MYYIYNLLGQILYDIVFIISILTEDKKEKRLEF